MSNRNKLNTSYKQKRSIKMNELRIAVMQEQLERVEMEQREQHNDIHQLKQKMVAQRERMVNQRANRLEREQRLNAMRKRLEEKNII